MKTTRLETQHSWNLIQGRWSLKNIRNENIMDSLYPAQEITWQTFSNINKSVGIIRRFGTAWIYKIMALNVEYH